MYKIIFGWKKMSSGFTFGFLSSGFRVQVSPLGQDMLVCIGTFYKRVCWFFVLVFRNFWVLTFLDGGKVVVNLFASLLLLDIHWKKCCCWDTHLEHTSRARTYISKNFYYYKGETMEIFLHWFILKNNFFMRWVVLKWVGQSTYWFFVSKISKNFGYFCSALVIVFGIRSKS